MQVCSLNTTNHTDFAQMKCPFLIYLKTIATGSGTDGVLVLQALIFGVAGLAVCGTLVRVGVRLYLRKLGVIFL